MLWNFLPLDVDLRTPVLSISGQYLHSLKHLQGFLSTFLPVFLGVRVEALTNWSDRFLFLHWPNISLASFRNRVVFDLFSRGQFDSIISLNGGLEGLWVLIR